MSLPELIGIEIGGTKTQVVFGGRDGKIFDRQRFKVDRALGAQGIRNQIQSAIKVYKENNDGLIGIGVGFGGPVNRKSGQIACSHQIKGWAGFPLGAWLNELSGLPVVMDNDANVAALGEALAGAGVGLNPVFYVTLGSGVGGGSVVDGDIYHGATPGESEIGHIRLDRSGLIVEQECSGWAVDQKVRHAIQEYPNSGLAKVVGSHSSNEAKYLGPALAEGCHLAQNILTEMSQSLAFALSHVTHLFHPEVIVLGGGLSLLGDVLISQVCESFPSFLMDTLKPGPKIKLAELREDAVPVGALLMAAKAVSKANS